MVDFRISIECTKFLVYINGGGTILGSVPLFLYNLVHFSLHLIPEVLKYNSRTKERKIIV